MFMLRLRVQLEAVPMSVLMSLSMLIAPWYAIHESAYTTNSLVITLLILVTITMIARSSMGTCNDSLQVPLCIYVMSDNACVEAHQQQWGL